MRVQNSKLVLAALVTVLMAGMGSAAVQSADLLEYSSNNEFFDGPVMNIYFGDNGATDKIDVTWSSSRLEESIDGEVQNSVSFEVTQSNTKAVYSFRDPGLEDIYNWETVKGQVDVGATWSTERIRETVLNSHMADECADLDGSGDFSTGDFVITSAFDGFNFVKEIYCVDKTDKIGNVGEIDSNPRTVTSTTFKVTNSDGKIEKATISNGAKGDGVSERIGPNTAVVFAGQDSAGRMPPVSTDELVMHSNGYTYYDLVTGEQVTVNEGWKVIDRNDYESYLNSKQSIYQGLETWAANGEELREDVVKGVNHQANLASEEHPDTEFTDATFSEQDRTPESDLIEAGQMEIHSDELAFAQFNLYVDVCESQDISECDAMINVEKPTGVPSIVDLSTNQFTELESGEIAATIKNIGNSEGSFSTSATCGEDFSFTGVADRTNLEAGETETVTLPISASTTDKSSTTISGSCTVNVEETSTAQTVSQAISVSAEQQSECEEGTQYSQTQSFTLDNGETVERDVVVECVSSTGQTEEVKTCAEGEEAKRTGSGYECVLDGSTDDGLGGDGDEKSCFVSLFELGTGTEVGFPNPVCELGKVFGGLYGNITLLGSILSGALLFGMRNTVGKIMSLEPTKTLSVLGRSVPAQYLLGLVLFTIGFMIGLNLMTNPLFKWGITIVTLVVGIVKLYFQGPYGLISWLLPNPRQ